MPRGKGPYVECPACGHPETTVSRNGILKCPNCKEVWQCGGCGMWLTEDADHRNCDELSSIVDNLG
jgi:hypothetical protein